MATPGTEVSPQTRGLRARWRTYPRKWALAGGLLGVTVGAAVGFPFVMLAAVSSREEFLWIGLVVLPIAFEVVCLLVGRRIDRKRMSGGVLGNTR